MRVSLAFLVRHWRWPVFGVGVSVVVLTALLSLAVRWQLGHLLQIEGGRMPRIEALLDGAEVHARNAHWGIRGLVPFVRLDGVDLRTADGLQFHAAVAAVELDTVESLVRLTPILARLQLEGAELTLRQRADGRWWAPGKATAEAWTREDTARLSDLLWESDRIAVDRFTALLYPYGQPALKLGLTAQLSNRQGDHRAKVQLHCGGVCAGSLDYTLDGNPLFGVRNGGLALAVRGLPQLRGVMRAGAAWLDLLDNRMNLRVGVRDGVAVVRGSAKFGVALRGTDGVLNLRARSSIVGGGRDGYDLQFPDLALALNEVVLPLGGTVLGRRDADWFARLPSFRLETLLQPVARTAVLGEVASRWLAQMSPQVKVRDLRLHLGARFSYAAALDQLTLSAYQGAPKIRGANALLTGHADGGRIEFLADRFELGFPELYHQSFASVSIKGPIDFWYARGLKLHSGWLVGDSTDFRVSGRFALDRPDDRSLQALTLLLEADEGRTDALRRYLPHILDAPLKRWLDGALGSGGLPHAMVAVHSYAIPQTGRRSQVEVAADVVNMAMRFEPDWPSITGLDARVLVTNQHVFADVRRARIGAAPNAIELGVGKVTILPADRHVGLALAGHASTAGLIHFLRASPVRQQLPWLAEWEGGGSFDLRLNGRIALDDDRHDFTVNTVQRNTRLANARLHVRLDGLAGALRYRYPALVDAPAIQGVLNGQRLRVAVASNANQIRFNAQGVGDGGWLENWLPWPMARASSGDFKWQAEMRIATTSSAAAPSGETLLTLSTDLAGFGLALPAPLTKPAAQRRPARFRLRSFEDNVQLGFEDGVLGLRAELRNGTLARGVVGIGRPLEAMPTSGLRVAGAPRELDVLAWAGLIAAGQSGLSLGVRADLEPARVLLGDLNLPDGRLSVRLVENRYRVEFAQRDFEGALDIYRDQRPMRLALRRARLPREEEPAGPQRSFAALQNDAPADDPLLGWRIKDFPSMAVDVAALFYGDELLGKVRFDLQPVADGIELRGVTGALRGLAFDDARLTWRRDGRGDNTRFFGLLETTDVSAVLESFGYAGSLASEQLSLRTDLGWVGSPLAFRLRNLDGGAEIELQDGRFVQVEGAGAARLLGIFDFAAIARRARLDFTDVFGKGLSFDKIEGRLQFAAGALSFPTALRIEGPGSEFRLGGTVDLATGSLSNDMIVTLPLSHTLPWYAAYAALTANPLAGAGVLVAQRLLRDQINVFSTAKYHVSGTIDEPLVSFVSVFDRKLEQAPADNKLSQEPLPAPAASSALRRSGAGSAATPTTLLPLASTTRPAADAPTCAADRTYEDARCD